MNYEITKYNSLKETISENFKKIDEEHTDSLGAEDRDMYERGFKDGWDAAIDEMISLVGSNAYRFKVHYPYKKFYEYDNEESEEFKEEVKSCKWENIIESMLNGIQMNFKQKNGFKKELNDKIQEKIGVKNSIKDIVVEGKNLESSLYWISCIYINVILKSTIKIDDFPDSFVRNEIEKFTTKVLDIRDPIEISFETTKQRRKRFRNG